MLLENNICSSGKLLLAERLFKLGARPPLVCAVCKISTKTAIRWYKTINQCAPKQGMLPYDLFWISNSAVHNIHASIFLGLIHDYCKACNQTTFNAKILIDAFNLYGQVVTNNPTLSKREKSAKNTLLLDINRAWQLANQLTYGAIQLKICEKCKTRFVVLNKLPIPFQQCPICDVWADKIGRRRWKTVVCKNKIP